MKYLIVLLLTSVACFGAPTNTVVKIMVPIVEQTSDGEFHDALYFTLEQWNAMTDAQLAAMKHQRVTNWQAFLVEAKQPQPEPTEDELADAVKAQEEMVVRQAEALNATKAQLAVKVTKRVALEKAAVEKLEQPVVEDKP